MVGGIINQKKLTNEEMKLFLSDIKKLKNPEMLKCGAKYVIRINLKNDTLRLKERNADIIFQIGLEIFIILYRIMKI